MYDNYAQHDDCLKLSEKRVLGLLDDISVWVNDNFGIGISFVDDLSCGNGVTSVTKAGAVPTVEIGIGGLSTGRFLKKVSDYNFISAGVAIFHEVDHCLSEIETDTSAVVVCSSLATVQNPYIYSINRFHLPHEIQAEYSGVLGMWDMMYDLFPNDVDLVDNCMLNYVNHKASTLSYAIDCSYDDDHNIVFYSDRQSVEQAFVDAFEQSLTCDRAYLSKFNLCDDEAICLVRKDGTLQNCDPEFEPFVMSLFNERDGTNWDKKVCACVLHLHPEWRQSHKVLMEQPLTMESEFGMPFPETSEESRLRLNIDNVRYKNNKKKSLSLTAEKDPYENIAMKLHDETRGKGTLFKSDKSDDYDY